MDIMEVLSRITEVFKQLLIIALTVLAVVGVRAVLELTKTLRKTRQVVDDVGKEAGDIVRNANETIEQLQPIVTKVDAMVDDLEPAVAEVQPLIEKASTAIDVVTVDRASVNDILVDVSSVTDTASNVTSTVSKAANSAVSGVAGVVGKFTGAKSKRQRKLAEKSESSVEVKRIRGNKEAESSEPQVEPKRDYFTYGDTEGEV